MRRVHGEPHELRTAASSLAVTTSSTSPSMYASINDPGVRTAIPLAIVLIVEQLQAERALPGDHVGRLERVNLDPSRSGAPRILDDPVRCPLDIPDRHELRHSRKCSWSLAEATPTPGHTSSGWWGHAAGAPVFRSAGWS
ncbi:MAG: hypothetical protein ACRDYX_10945 [Egibacteraceae bacterium]